MNNSLTVIENTWSSVSTSCLRPANQCKYCHNSPFLNTIIQPDVVICHSSFFIQSWTSIINPDWKKIHLFLLEKEKGHHFCQRRQKLEKLQSRLIFAYEYVHMKTYCFASVLLQWCTLRVALTAALLPARERLKLGNSVLWAGVFSLQAATIPQLINFIF